MHINNVCTAFRFIHDEISQLTRYSMVAHTAFAASMAMKMRYHDDVGEVPQSIRVDLSHTSSLTSTQIAMPLLLDVSTSHPQLYSPLPLVSSQFIPRLLGTGSLMQHQISQPSIRSHTLRFADREWGSKEGYKVELPRQDVRDAAHMHAL